MGATFSDDNGDLITNSDGNRVTKVKEISSTDEYQQVLQDMCSIIVVFFKTPWCVPCRLITPHYKNMASKYNGISCYQVNIEELDDLASSCRVKAIPSFYIYSGGIKLDHLLGDDISQLEQMINCHRAHYGLMKNKTDTIANTTFDVPITKRLFFSTAMQTAEFDRSRGISHILFVDRQMKFKPGFITKTIDLLEPIALSHRLDDCIAFINDSRTRGNCLVISTSNIYVGAAVIVAFLMYHFRISFGAAYAAMRKKAPLVMLSEGYVEILRKRDTNGYITKHNFPEIKTDRVTSASTISTTVVTPNSNVDTPCSRTGDSTPLERASSVDSSTGMISPIHVSARINEDY